MIHFRLLSIQSAARNQNKTRKAGGQRTVLPVTSNGKHNGHLRERLPLVIFLNLWGPIVATTFWTAPTRGIVVWCNMGREFCRANLRLISRLFLKKPPSGNKRIHVRFKGMYTSDRWAVNSVKDRSRRAFPYVNKNHINDSRLVYLFPRDDNEINQVTNRTDEEILMEPRNHSEISFHEHSVHNPHNVTGTTVQGRHYQWHIRGWLMID